MTFWKLGLLLGAVILLSCQGMKKQPNSSPPQPDIPQAPREAKVLQKHGDRRLDPYFWMNQRDSKNVLDYIQAENLYADSILAKSKSLSDQLFNEMKGRILEDDATAPYKKDNYYYYVRYEKGKEYPIYCRKKGSLEGREEIILDVNALAHGKKYYSAYVSDISPNHEWLAFAVDDVGRRFYTLYFKNLKTQEILKDKIVDVTGNWVWATDSIGFYSYQHRETLRSERIFRYDLQKKKSVEVFFEKDETFNVGISKTLNGQTLIIDTGSTDSSEVQTLPAQDPEGRFKVFLKREKKHEYSVFDGGDAFYILTNWKAKNFRLMKTPYTNTAKSQWRDVIPHRETVFLEGIVVFKNFIAAAVRTKGLTQIELRDRRTKKLSRIAFPDPVYDTGIGTNEEYEAEVLRYYYNSMVQPASIYDYNVKTAKSNLIKQKDVPSYVASQYTSERVWSKSKDGARVPISLVYKIDKFKKGQNPLFVYGYGSYGMSMDASYNSNIISLLDRGFVYAIIHVRGGQEMGRDWFENGRLMKKKNTFTDFISATEHLVKTGYGKAGHIYMQGGSAGGLLMGAVMNLRPDLYHGVHAAVPFVDVVTTMLDDSIPLTTAEYEQWGNPNEKKAYKYIKSYSPYDNVTAKKYPHVLITTGYHDSQVQYWEPLKWAAKLRDHNQADSLIVMKTEMGAGHSGVTGRFSALKERADQYGFIVWLEENNKN
ncbi:MAG: S9 family peptidase [Bdellovibrionales bacterium]|nr:S9 family peptidase [Bdellovibrionales bacterium]